MLCPPEASSMIPCDQMENIGGCRYKGKFGTTTLTSSGTYTFNLENFSSFQIYQPGGSGNIVTNKYPTGTTTITLTGGMMFSVKSEQKCKYLARQTITYTWTSGTGIASYTW